MSTILITGASRGIGRATALRFAIPGNTLILVCKSNIDKLRALVEDIRARGAEVFPVQADISDSTEVTRLFDTIKAQGLSIDLLINNAAISYTGLLQDMTDAEWHTILDTNLSSVFYCCRAVIPMMLQNNGGKILNISSIWGTYGASCEVAYSASKGAVNSFTKALAKELAPSGIQVNAVSFGFIDTDMNAHLSAEEVQAFADTIPLGRIATAEEAADFIFKISEAGNYCTGQIIGFDGGY